LLPPYSDHDAFVHHTLHVPDDPDYTFVIESDLEGDCNGNPLCLLVDWSEQKPLLTGKQLLTHPLWKQTMN